MTEFNNDQLAEEVIPSYMLVCDEDGHWYVIYEEEEEDFHSWVEATTNGEEVEFDFSVCRLPGHPSSIRFPEYWEV